MLAALLLTLAAAPLPAPEAWARKACPPAREAPSGAEAYGREERRLACIRREMNRALDLIILPLKSKAPADAKGWMAVQADFNRWAERACRLAEDCAWIELHTGVRTEGSGGGWTWLQCTERMLAWRGWYAVLQLRGGDALARFLREEATRGEEARLAWTGTYETLTLNAQKPPRPAQAPLAGAVLDAAAWRSLQERVGEVGAAPSAIAARQCALPGTGLASGCPDTLADALVSLLRLEWLQ